MNRDNETFEAWAMTLAQDLVNVSIYPDGLVVVWADDGSLREWDLTRLSDAGTGA